MRQTIKRRILFWLAFRLYYPLYSPWRGNSPAEEAVDIGLIKDLVEFKHACDDVIIWLSIFYLHTHDLNRGQAEEFLKTDYGRFFFNFFKKTVPSFILNGSIKILLQGIKNGYCQSRWTTSLVGGKFDFKSLWMDGCHPLPDSISIVAISTFQESLASQDSNFRPLADTTALQVNIRINSWPDCIRI